jgi:hypothetical protein
MLQHTQSLLEICYKGCVICFIDFDGDIEGVGTRIINLSQEEFSTLKKLIGQIEFEEKEEPDYIEIAKLAMSKIKSTAEQSLKHLEENDMIWDDDLKMIRNKLVEIELINAKLDPYR